MEKEAQLRENCCKSCGRMLPPAYNREYCPNCEELQLFGAVRDYIRANEVNEYEVAEHFHISVRLVKDWIREGRIEYKEHGEKSIGSAYCSRCGAKISFGTMCTKCIKLLNGENQPRGFAAAPDQEEEKMHFFDRD